MSVSEQVCNEKLMLNTGAEYCRFSFLEAEQSSFSYSFKCRKFQIPLHIGKRD